MEIDIFCRAVIMHGIHRLCTPDEHDWANSATALNARSFRHMLFHMFPDQFLAAERRSWIWKWHCLVEHYAARWVIRSTWNITHVQRWWDNYFQFGNNIIVFSNGKKKEARKKGNICLENIETEQVKNCKFWMIELTHQVTTIQKMWVYDPFPTRMHLLFFVPGQSHPIRSFFNFFVVLHSNYCWEVRAGLLIYLHFVPQYASLYLSI